MDDAKGSDRKEKSSRLVKFTQTEFDQALLQAVDQALATQSLSFSDLCKQALQQMLLSPQPADATEVVPDALSVLQQQMLQLQMQMARIEGKEEARQRYALRRVEQQVRELGDRLSTLERKEYLEQQVRQLTDRLARLELPDEQQSLPRISNGAAPELEPSEPIDPLLSRLAPLLEDF